MYLCNINSVTQYLDPLLVYYSWRNRSLSSPLDMLSLLSSFCCNSSRTLNALNATFREHFKANAILNLKNNDKENTSRGPHSSVLRFPILWQSHVMQIFTVVTLQVQIFTGLDRNNLRELIKTSRGTFLREFQSRIFIHLSCICLLTFNA